MPELRAFLRERDETFAALGSHWSRLPGVGPLNGPSDLQERHQGKDQRVRYARSPRCAQARSGGRDTTARSGHHADNGARGRFLDGSGLRALPGDTSRFDPYGDGVFQDRRLLCGRRLFARALTSLAGGAGFG